MSVEVEERQFCTDAEAVRHYSVKLFEAMSDFLFAGSTFEQVVAVRSILQHFKVDQNRIDAVLRRAANRQAFPFHLFRAAA